jgi:hypothetical protein
MKIGFSTSNSVVSKIIRKLTKSKVSHTYIKCQVERYDVVLHANQHGVEFDKYNDFDRKFEIVAEYDLKLTAEQEDAFMAYAIRQLDRSYDFLGVAGFMWVLLNRSFGRKVKNPFSNKSAYYCSELIICSLQAAQFVGSELFDKDLVTPEELLVFLNTHPLAVKV